MFHFKYKNARHGLFRPKSWLFQCESPFRPNLHSNSVRHSKIRIGTVVPESNLDLLLAENLSFRTCNHRFLLLCQYNFLGYSSYVSKKCKVVYGLLLICGGLVFFTIRWWNPTTFAAMHPEGTDQRVSWPYVENRSFLWTWLFLVPLIVYTLWQVLYFLIVNVLRGQRLLRDPEVMTSYRELSKKAQKANNVLWHVSGLLGDQNRPLIYIVYQALFTLATVALTVPIFMSYELHMIFQIFKISAAVWNGGSFVLDVMPRQVIKKEKKKIANMNPMESYEKPVTPNTNS